MSLWSGESQLPQLRGEGDDDTGKYGSGKKCGGKCGPQWRLTAILVVLIFGVGAFVALEIAIVAKGDQLEATSKATEDIGSALKKWRSNFPTNQETVTTQQILDSIDKAHTTIAWIEQVRRGITPETLHAVANNVNSLVGNATMFIDMISSAFTSKKSGASLRGENEMMHSAGGLLQKGTELLGAISADEFHQAFTTTHSAIQSFVRLSKDVSHEKITRIVDSAADILGAADAEHIVTVISDLTKGVSSVIHRFSEPGAGLRLSLPIEMPESGKHMSPPAAAAAAVKIAKNEK